MHASGGAGQLVVDRRLVGGGRAGVRHLEHAGDATKDGSPAATFQVFLMLVAGLTHMRLAIDGAGQHMQTIGFENFRSPGMGKGTDGGDTAIFHANIRFADAIDGGGNAPTYQKVECLAHGFVRNPRPCTLASLMAGTTS